MEAGRALRAWELKPFQKYLEEGGAAGHKRCFSSLLIKRSFGACAGQMFGSNRIISFMFCLSKKIFDSRKTPGELEGVRRNGTAVFVLHRLFFAVIGCSIVRYSCEQW